MKNLLFISEIILAGLLISCNGDIGGGGGDEEIPPDFFFSFVDEDGLDIFSYPAYDKDSTFLRVPFESGAKSALLLIPSSLKNDVAVLGPLANNALSGGLGETGTVGNEREFKYERCFYFSNGDIDTLKVVVRCTETCIYQDKVMQIYYNQKLIHDFDFRGKDRDLLDRMMDNNYKPFGDTVVFVIPKVL